MSAEELGRVWAQALEERILEVGPDNVACFIGDPIQGAGGVIVPPANYWGEIQKICNKYEILLAADEVICGFGRTGNWFGSDTFGIKPDIISMPQIQQPSQKIIWRLIRLEHALPCQLQFPNHRFYQIQARS